MAFGIRKLTNKETFILMGLTEEDCENCEKMGISKTQLYKQAGNGLVTNCVQFICEHIWKVTHPDYICTDELLVEEGYGCDESC